MHRRTILKAGGAAALARPALLSAATEAPLPKVGSPLRLVDIPLLDGGVFRAADADRHVTVVYWWASWCPFCAVQTPYMQQLWDTHRSRGLKMIGLSVDRRIEDARRYVTQRGYSFPTGFNSRDIEEQFPKPGKGLPVTCVRGRDGRVLLAEMGQMFPEDVADIARLLGPSPP